MAVVSAAFAAGSAAEDWPTYLHDESRSSLSGETSISVANAAQLTRLWRFRTDGPVAASPTAVGGVVYVGSWDGYEYALDATDGVLKWKTFLGVTTGAAECSYPQSVGVTSSATVRNGVVYVGGGDSYWYALDAATGAELWKVFTGDNSAAGGHYNWSSPLIYNGSAYIGVSSLGDCPLVQGKLLRVDLSTHQVAATFDAAPDGETGGGIWTSPTVDSATNTIFVTTGTSSQTSNLVGAAIVALDATTLAVKGSWQVPPDQQVADNDWGNTPTLISGGLVVATNKNGIVYAFQRSNISAGPVWQQRIANGGDCPVCGDGSVSSSAFDGTRLYAAGGRTSINGTSYPGSIAAFDPLTGAVLWNQGLQDSVIPAVTAVNGLVMAGAGSNFTVSSATTGATLFSYATGGPIYSPVAVSGGRALVGSQDGFVYAFGEPTSLPPPPPNTVRVNAGGTTYIDSQAGTWSPDCCNNGGSVFSTNSAIAGTNDPELYQTERWIAGSFTYTFTGLAAGAYKVTLKFAEIAYVAPGDRQFNVAINGSRVLTNFDVAAQVGFNTALDRTFTSSVGSNGQLAVSFGQGAADNPMVSAIEVLPAASGTLSFQSAPQTLTAGQPSAPMQVGLSSPQGVDTSVTLSSNSGSGRFSTGSGGPWSTSLAVTVPAGQAVSSSFFYRDTTAGMPELTASASGFATASQSETVTAAPLATIAVSPANVTLSPGAAQLLTAAGSDQYGNTVDVSSAGWTTTAPGSLSPTVGTTTTFTAGSSTGSGSVTARVGMVAGSASVTVAIAATAKRVNAGGASYVDSTGKTWSADCCYSGGNVFTTTAPISGTNDPTLYQSERWVSGTFRYTFTGLAPGACQVTLKFAEIAGLGPGQRQFNVAINATRVLTDFDVSAQVGQYAALDRTFAASVDANGQLTVTFSRGAVDNPIVSAIQVVSASGPGTLSFPGAAQTLTAGQASAPMQVGISSPPQSNVTLALSSSSSSGQFATSASGPWSSTLTTTIAAGQTTSSAFFYRDTKAGTPTLTASASGFSNATQTQTVNAAALASIAVSPGNQSVIVGFTQAFSAAGADQYGNVVAVTGSAWSTTVAGGSVSPTTGSSTTFKAGATTGSGSVKAQVGSIAGVASVTVVPVPAPSSLTATAKAKGRIGLAWQATAAGVTYSVYRGTASQQEAAVPYATGITGTSFNDQSVVPRTTYYYYVVAVGPGGNRSTPSNEASATAK